MKASQSSDSTDQQSRSAIAALGGARPGAGSQHFRFISVQEKGGARRRKSPRRV